MQSDNFLQACWSLHGLHASGRVFFPFISGKTALLVSLLLDKKEYCFCDYKVYDANSDMADING